MKALLLAWGLAVALQAQAAADPAYAALPGAKALVVAESRPKSVRGLAFGQPNDLLASATARSQCEAAAGPGDVCELVWLNEQAVTSGTEIRARLPATPHPLFLWHFDQGANDVYLAGSIHILKRSLYPLPSQLEAAFAQADHLVVEVNTDALSPTALADLTWRHGELPAGQTLQNVLSPELHARTLQSLRTLGIDPTLVARSNPAMVAVQLATLRMISLGYDPESGLENHFLGRRGGRQVLQLETLDAQLTLMFGQPMSTQTKLLEATLELESEVEPFLADMVAAWLAGDDAAFVQAFEAQSGDSAEARAFNRQLLDERNVTMADGIAELLRGTSGPGGSYFVLVGAAHLVGEQGIVPQLAARGLRGRRIHSDEQLTEPLEATP